MFKIVIIILKGMYLPNYYYSICIFLDCPSLRENSGKQILVIMLIIAVGLFFTAAIFVTVLIYTRTKSIGEYLIV